MDAKEKEICIELVKKLEHYFDRIGLRDQYDMKKDHLELLKKAKKVLKLEEN